MITCLNELLRVPCSLLLQRKREWKWERVQRKKRTIRKFYDPSFCLFFWLPIFQRFPARRLSLLPPEPPLARTYTARRRSLYIRTAMV